MIKSTNIYWIATETVGRLGIMPRPRGGDWLADEIRDWQMQGVDRVVCLLTPGEINELSLEREGELCKQQGIAFTPYPIPDLSVPVADDALAVIDGIAAAVSGGEMVAIHCWGGIGRSGMMASGVLVLLGMTPGAAMDQVSAVRGVRVPETDEQIAWVQQVNAHGSGSDPAPSG